MAVSAPGVYGGIVDCVRQIVCGEGAGAPHRRMSSSTFTHMCNSTRATSLRPSGTRHFRSSTSAPHAHAPTHPHTQPPFPKALYQGLHTRTHCPGALYQGLGTSLVGIVPYAGIDLAANSVLKDVASRYCALLAGLPTR